MPTFRTACRIVARHRIYLMVYLVLLSVMGVFVVTGYDTDSRSFHEQLARVAVIDRDGSALSRGLASYLAGFSVAELSDEGKLTEVEDSREALADLVAQDVVSYVLVIPKGFGESFMTAAAAGADAPTLETVVSYQGGSGILMDLRTTQFLQSAYGYASTMALGDETETVRLAQDAMSERAEVVVLPTEVEEVSPRLIGYLGWCTYPLFCVATVMVSVLMASLNETDLRRRTLSAPVTSVSHSVQTYLACTVLALVSWAWVVGLGLVSCGVGALVESTTQVALMALALFAYALVGVSFGFLFGQLGVSEMLANAIGNVGGMILSFLGGAWMPLELLDEGVRTVARLTPSYWTGVAVNAARDMGSLGWADAQPSLVATAIVGLFALALTIVGFAVGRERRREA